ncbi:MAG: response regulator transcription factor [Lachnospiraceae bacterium]|jgi:DNA-binding response OmpR family regulator|nr:response regulator transcription factor [Lachnospiraceae bacterium]
MKDIVIIEDDAALNHGIALALRRDDFRFHQCFKLGDFKASEKADLIILDVNLPDGNGFDFLKKLRKMSATPVIMLTANDLETDEVMGFELGADDYVTKPFSLMVLRARIEKLLRKTGEPKKDAYEDGTYSFDFERMVFLAGAEAVELSKTEQRLLRLLVRNQDQTLTRDFLVDRIWTDGAEYVDENALSVTVARLRKKLNANDRIQTVYGIGYSWRAKG